MDYSFLQILKNFRFLLHHWGLIIITISSSIGSSFMAGLSISFIIPIMSDTQILSKKNMPFPFDKILLAFSGLNLSEKLRIIAVLLIAIFIVKSICQVASLVASSRLTIISIKYFRIKCYEQLMNVGMGYYYNRKAGDYHTICASFCNSLGMLSNFVFLAIPQFLNILIFLTMGLILSWKMVLLSIVLAIIISVLLKKHMHMAERRGKEYTIAHTRFTSESIELIAAMKVIRLFSKEKDEIKRFENEIDFFNQASYRIGILRGSTAPYYELMAIMALACIIIIGSYLFVGPNNIGLPGLAIFTIIFQRISSEANGINQKRVNIIGDITSYREVLKFLSPIDKEYVRSGTKVFSGTTEGIEFKNVTFRYNSKKNLVLDNINFHIPVGKKTGVVGPSGAGKSTITELLLRFYDPQEGQILIDGIDLKEFDINSWRRWIGVVSQDVFLFNDTIGANIAFARPDATQDEIEQAAYKAHAHEFIQQFPNGYDTLVGDRGVLLSGGQKQRVAIARAIIINPQILIFDEATSSLDTESERIVQDALDEISQGRTVITIAHRLSTVFSSDNVIVLNSGNIVEQGTHSELMKKNGFYYKLVKMQELVI